MKLKSTIQLKNSLEGSTTGLSRQRRTEITNLNIGQLNSGSLRSKNLKTEWRKATITPAICVTPSSTSSSALWEPDREERGRGRKSISGNTVRSFQMWWKQRSTNPRNSIKFQGGLTQRLVSRHINKPSLRQNKQRLLKEETESSVRSVNFSPRNHAVRRVGGSIRTLNCVLKNGC